MTLTTHAAMGSLLAASVSSPVTGFALGIALHLLVDVIPHGDTGMYDGFHGKTKRRRAVAYVTTDACLAIMTVLLAISLRGDTTATENHIFAATVLGSILPDLIVGLEIVYKNRFIKKLTKVHFLFHDFVSRRYGDVPLIFGLSYQVVFIVFVFQKLALGG